jgi:outer membrane usher protein
MKTALFASAAWLGASGFAFAADPNSTAPATPGAAPAALSAAAPVAALAQGSGAPIAPAAHAPINTTGRTISLTVPMKDGAYDLGDIILSIDPQDRISFSQQRTLDLLSKVLDAAIVNQLKTRWTGQSMLTPDSFADTGITAVYDPKRLELVMLIPASLRATRSVAVSALDQQRIGNYLKPATFDAYLNVRGNVGWNGTGTNRGVQDPVFALEGAARWGGLVLESEGVWQPGVSNHPFQRQGSRFVYDDMRDLIRVTAGDLQPVGQGFQAVPDMAGISIFRSYGALEPEFLARPRGDQQFTLTRTSTLEVYVNGQLVRRLQLNPGNYNARDFPFTQGSNNVILNIIDDTGARQTLRFNSFFDQTMLAKGLSEFGLYVGVMAPLGLDGPHYTSDMTYSGWYRRGLTKWLTLGINSQGDQHTVMAGASGIIAFPIGILSVDAATSRVQGFGEGSAVALTFQRLFQLSGGRSSALNLFFNSRSKTFGTVSDFAPNNPYTFESGDGYTQAINDYLYGGLEARFSKGRGLNPDVQTYRTTLGWRITPTVAATLDTIYDDTRISGSQKNFSVVVSLTKRLTPWSSLRADYDSRYDRSQLTYQAISGQGVGSWNVNADIEHTPQTNGINGTFNYLTNRGEVGLSTFSNFDSGFSSVTTSVTTFRFASAIAVADGVWSLGRPIYDAFAVVKPYSAIRNADILVNPSPFGFDADTGHLGTALEPSLTAYSQRTIAVDIGGAAPEGFDIGKGSFRMFPPHRGAYVLEVGSAYSVTAIGRLIGPDGAPVSLIAGKAIEIAHPDRAPVEIFTNRDGRFGASGLKAGDWRIEMPTGDTTTVYILHVPDRTIGAMRAGDLMPASTGR